MKITLNVYGKRYEFAYSKNFRLLYKREDGGKAFYPFTRFHSWTVLTGKTVALPDKITLSKADIIARIKKKLKLPNNG